MCGACRNALSCRVQRPPAISSISPLMAIMASQKRSSSERSSLSVGSTISVPATGKLTVGAWKP